MAKESTSTRIPRLDGASRIPLPGGIRPPAKPTAQIQRATQLLRPTAPLITQRPISYPVFKQPTLLATTAQPLPVTASATVTATVAGQENALKKTSSGERLNNALNIVSKKSTTALKKLFGSGKSDKVLKQQQNNQQQQQQQRQQLGVKPSTVRTTDASLHKTQILSENNTNTKEANSTRSLARSSTYIRDDSPREVVNLTHNLLAQSTPAPGAAKVRPVSETTPLLGFSTMRQAINKTRSLDVTTLISSTESPMLGDAGDTLDDQKLLQRTQTLEHTHVVNSPMGETHVLGDTVCLNSPAEPQMDATKIIHANNETKTLANTDVLGKTMCVHAPSEHLHKCTPVLGTTMNLSGPNCAQPLNSTHVVEKFNDPELTHTVVKGTHANTNELASPASNATYSNPGSVENFILLDDVSVPSGFDFDVTLQSQTDLNRTLKNLLDGFDDTMAVLVPDKANMKLPLNSTMNTERLVDLTGSNSGNRLMNFKDFIEASPKNNVGNTTQLLYMTQVSSSASTTPDCNTKFGNAGNSTIIIPGYQNMQLPAHLLSPFLLKGAQSEVVLPTRTPEDERSGDAMDVDATLTAAGARTEEFFSRMQQKCKDDIAMSLQDVNNPNSKHKGRFSFGLDLTESTLDCSIELVDASISSTGPLQSSANHTLSSTVPQSPCSQQLQQQQQQQMLKKQNSFELDESLGILTPDQMKEFLDSTTTNNTNNLDLPLNLHPMASNSHKAALHHMRIDQTPSPEELPLDPVEVKTDITDIILAQQQQQMQASQSTQHNQQVQHLQSTSVSTEPISLHTDTELSKADPMTKSNVSKISTSFITSVTSVTSLDTGYQGDGEMSRPASRGACDHSPSNGPAARKGGGGFGHVSRQPSFQQQPPLPPPIRRQDPMTDSDFFTESDADDIFHRGDRRAQVIDGQLYGPAFQQGAASVFITEDPQMEDSCMESSGIFTDVENRCDEDLAQMRHQDTQEAVLDMSPDGECDNSTETVRSNRENASKAARAQRDCETTAINANDALGQGQAAAGLSSSQTSSTIQSSFSNDRLSAATTLSNRTSYCSVDGSSSANALDCKSFLSLDEAFGERAATCASAGETNMKRRAKSTTSTTGSANAPSTGKQQSLEQQQQPPSAVRRVSSPRNHASSSSLCNVVNRNKSLSSSQSSSSNSPGTGKPGAAVRKSHTPNKWDAVMHKIASNKALIKKNYNDVKSKVSTRMNMAGGGTSGSGGGGGGRGTAASSANGGGTPISSGSVANTPTVRRSPPLVQTATTSSSVRAMSPSVMSNKVLSSASKAHISGASGANMPKDTQTGTSGLYAKRLLQNGATVKRVRSYSKDSQKSSQSDLSLASGSPKLLAKTPLRAAKKRDVRNLSISPTDLGPPPKTQQTVNGTPTRPKTTVITVTQRRISDSQASSVRTSIPSLDTTITGLSTPSGTGSIKSSPPPKKITITRRLDIKTTPRGPTKDHNRITTPSSIATLKHVDGKQTDIPTELQVLEHSLHNNNNTISSTVSSSAATTPTSPTIGSTDKAGTSSATGSPVLSQKLGSKKIAIHASAATAAKVQNTSAEKKTQAKSTRKSLFKKQTQLPEAKHHTPMEASPPPEDRPGDYVEALQQLKLLSNFLTNGTLDFHGLEKHLQKSEALQLEKQRQDTSVEAMGVLLNYLVHDLDAFACPNAKSESTKAKDDLMKTMHRLEESTTTCSELQDQLCEKDTYYRQREDELQSLHRCEVEKAKSTLLDYELHAKEQISMLENQVTMKDAEFKRNFDCYRMEMENKMQHKQEELEAAQKRERALEERLSAAECNEASLRDLLTSKTNYYEESLTAAAEREKGLNERIQVLTMELDSLRRVKRSQDRELKEKLNLSQDEVAILRTPRRSNQEIVDRTSSSSSMSPRNSANSEITRLQSEAESLRCVLELKQKQISQLTKQNEELMRDANDRLALQNKISLLESQNELLRSENELKSEREKEYLRQFDDIQKAFNHEAYRRTRLACDNEALQWQLKQRSEQLHIVETKLHELSTNESLNGTNHTSFLGACSRTSLFNDSSMANMNTDDNSPPNSPKVKAVITKADSVSWVLQMDEDTPEAAASKMVKRAGSFRSIERSPQTRRQLSLSAASSNTSNGTLNGTNGSAPGPHPLSQSMSAAAVIRQHSSESTGAEFPPSRLHPRVRSKSMSVRKSEATAASMSAKNGKKSGRSHGASVNGRKQELSAPNTWKEPISSSSPYSSIRPRTSTIKMGSEDAEVENSEVPLFRRSSSSSASSRTLITCDTSALESGERLEMGALPNHSASHHHDLKLLKKWQEIQESAGEAMVSGTNSEDEGCSASSDELVSTASTASASASGTTGSNTSLHQMNNSQIFEMLLLDKVCSLDGTPMECSWSEDVDTVPKGV